MSSENIGIYRHKHTGKATFSLSLSFAAYEDWINKEYGAETYPGLG